MSTRRRGDSPPTLVVAARRKASPASLKLRRAPSWPADTLPLVLACGLCGRHLLPGELYRLFRGERGREVVVCQLCEPNAHELHWLMDDQPRLRVPVHDLARTVRTAA